MIIQKSVSLSGFFLIIFLVWQVNCFENKCPNKWFFFCISYFQLLLLLQSLYVAKMFVLLLCFIINKTSAAQLNSRLLEFIFRFYFVFVKPCRTFENDFVSWEFFGLRSITCTWVRTRRQTKTAWNCAIAHKYLLLLFLFFLSFVHFIC